MSKAAVLIGLMALAPLAARAQTPPLVGSRYVAMGSSFAAGPGVTTSADDPPNRCARSKDNYAHQLARRRSLDLVDVSCSGATTAHLLGSWKELKPQLDAVDAATRLVTVTIGGNDVRLTAGLGAASCHTGQDLDCANLPALPTEAEWAGLEMRLTQIAAEVHRRAPRARLVFVDYTTVLPPEGTCAAVSLTPAQAETYRQINARVVAATARVAKAAGSDLVTASTITAAHNACAAEPWANGDLPDDGAPFHPRLEAHTAIAEALDRAIWR
jgi:lysophospholipase L1-like esterase